MKDEELKKALNYLGIKDRGASYRIDPNTGKVQKEGLFGWSDTGYRVDKESGKLQKEGWLGSYDTGDRIDPKTGKVQKEGLFGWSDTGYRIEKESGELQKEGCLGSYDAGYRLEKKTGRIQKQGWFGWINNGIFDNKNTNCIKSMNYTSANNALQSVSGKYNTSAQQSSEFFNLIKYALFGIIFIIVGWLIISISSPLSLAWWLGAIFVLIGGIAVIPLALILTIIGLSILITLLIAIISIAIFIEVIEIIINSK